LADPQKRFALEVEVTISTEVNNVLHAACTALQSADLMIMLTGAVEIATVRELMRNPVTHSLRMKLEALAKRAPPPLPSAAAAETLSPSPTPPTDAAAAGKGPRARARSEKGAAFDASKRAKSSGGTPRAVAPEPAVEDVSSKPNLGEATGLEATALAMCAPMTKYYDDTVEVKRSGLLGRLEAARACFNPLKGSPVTTHNVEALEQSFKLCAHPNLALCVEGMKLELSKYNGLVRLIPDPATRLDDKGRDTFNMSHWWASASAEIPNTAKLLRAVLCHVPSSCAPERAFSILNHSFGNEQKNALADYMELSMQRQFNKRTRD